MRLWFTFVSYLPLRIIYVGAALCFYIAYRVAGYRRATVKDNLRHAFPDWSTAQIDKTCGAVYQSLAQVSAEIVKLPRMSRTEIEHAVELKSPDNTRWRTQPAIIISAHQGNWEWLFQRLVLAIQHPVYGIYKPLHNRGTDEFIYQVRTRFGAKLVAYKTFSATALKLREHSCLLMGDQSPSSHSKVVWLEFLHREVPFYAGVARLSTILKLPVFYVSLLRTARGRYQAQINYLGVADKESEEELLKKYIHCMETSIRKQPETWLWTHRRWKKAKAGVSESF